MCCTWPLSLAESGLRGSASPATAAGAIERSSSFAYAAAGCCVRLPALVVVRVGIVADTSNYQTGMALYNASAFYLEADGLMLCCNAVSRGGGGLELIARCNVAIMNLGGVNGSDCTVAALVPLRAKAKVAAVVARLVGLILCHGLRLSCLMGNRASPSVTCNYPSCTSAIYSHSCIPTVRSITQYNLHLHHLFQFHGTLQNRPKTRQIDHNTALILLPPPPSRAGHCKGQEWRM
jgi:hypothetical protein